MEFTKFDYHGFEGLQFTFDNLPAKIVMPKLSLTVNGCIKRNILTPFHRLK